ncbi:hypothetical protein RNJ44_01830 [Nakaseomyces bracarensis]|uniref:tRNA 4-demethylwyosine synthase (AdoMet-dependent) n=1 Tax=Nakaseomyces bracarensis TaxID=273131 RepID=A0ABR4NNX9_9SACH
MSTIDTVIGSTLAVFSLVYLYFGGRISYVLAVVVGFCIYYNERNKVNEVVDEKKVNVVINEVVLPKKKKCCGGGVGGKCCSETKAEGGEKTGHTGGSCCSTKKKVEPLLQKLKEEKKSTDENSFPVSVDFTDAFKPVAKKVKKVPKVFSAKKKEEEPIEDIVKSALTVSNVELLSSQIYVFYSSLQGAAERVAATVAEDLKNVKNLTLEPKLINLDELNDIDEYFVDVPVDNALYVLVVPSYDTDCPLDYFLQTLEENYHDHRIDMFPLKKLVGFAVLGLGDSESWPDKFCYQAKNVDHWIAKLGGRRIFPVGEVCMKTEGMQGVDKWTNLLADTLEDDEPIIYQYDEDLQSDYEDDGEEQADNISIISGGSDVQDVEDIGGKSQKRSEFGMDVKQMVAKNSPTYKNLTKQGYRIIGSHSGVKICRWTKNELRGKGSCYKKSLFNIASSRCMELTPSLACSSKCVFCWRHGTNPVSKNWRWEVDSPEYILENALTNHYSMIKQLRGVPGVIAERFADAFKVRHCALSLVGEPILYPYINKFVELLHEHDITSFLVCNAQHPEPLRNIGKVTQLYVSIDAPTKNELKKVDRPLYKDFWERMMECLDILREVQYHQRTVFRLTLVKGFNMGDISSYADLVARGLPCFIEVKGATFSGSSDGNGNPLTMQNIPFYEECVNFVNEFCKELQRRGLDYEVAAEHAHSNCILIANTKFKVDGEWYTHIDFDKFFTLLNDEKRTEQFTYLDYMSKTPEWALFGNGGFAPGNVREIRKDKKRKNREERERLKKEAENMEPETKEEIQIEVEA